MPINLPALDISSLFAALIFGVVGFWLFKEGKREANFRNIFIGLALMIYPYFVSGPKLNWGIGILLCSVAYYFRYD